MRTVARRVATGAATLALLTGGAVAMAPAASAVGYSACTKYINAWGSTTTSVHLRTGPSTGYTSLGILSRGTSAYMRCTAKSGSWTYVSVHEGANKGKVGWVYSSYIQKCSKEVFPC